MTARDSAQVACTVFKGSSKEPAPQPKAPEPGPRFWQGSSLDESDYGRFVHHSMPSRAETFCLQLSAVSKHVIPFTVNVSGGINNKGKGEGAGRMSQHVAGRGSGVLGEGGGG